MLTSTDEAIIGARLTELAHAGLVRADAASGRFDIEEAVKAALKDKVSCCSGLLMYEIPD